MRAGQRLLPFIIAVMTLPAGQAAAQTPPPSLPWQAGPCGAEFVKLREDVQKCRLAAKAAGQRKASREEMCKHMTAYSAAALKWVRYVETNTATCGIPAEVVQRLEQVHGKTEQIKERICAAAPAPGRPSLSDALGTTPLLTLETKPVPCDRPWLQIADP